MGLKLGKSYCLSILYKNPVKSTRVNRDFCPPVDPVEPENIPGVRLNNLRLKIRPVDPVQPEKFPGVRLKNLRLKTRPVTPVNREIFRPVTVENLRV